MHSMEGRGRLRELALRLCYVVRPSLGPKGLGLCTGNGRRRAYSYEVRITAEMIADLSNLTN
jgi:hypothetical protein